MDEDYVQLAGCVLLDDYGRVLLLHRDLGATGLWELPGGKVEEDEEPAAAAAREMTEELGVHVTLTRSLGSAAFEHEDTTYQFHWFVAVITDGTPRVMEPELHDDVDYVDTEDMPSMALSAGMEILYNKWLSSEVTFEP